MEPCLEQNLYHEVLAAQLRIKQDVVRTDLQLNQRLSEQFGANIFFKREDQQKVRSFKIRGALNALLKLSPEQKSKTVVCASAGNHAQGFASACFQLQVQGTVFMPKTTPAQKVERVRYFGKNKIKVVLCGDNFDEAYAQALVYQKQQQAMFVHPFDDRDVIAGQGTVGLEILEDVDADMVILPLGGGGLGAGVATVFKARSPRTKLLGVEPYHAASFHHSLKYNKNTTLEDIDVFADGTAVKRMGEQNFDICQQLIDDNDRITDKVLCRVLLDLYNFDGIVAEPSGVLAVAALWQRAEDIKGKTVVCILSGSNNDIARIDEIKRRAQYE